MLILPPYMRGGPAPAGGAPAWFSAMSDKTWAVPMSNWLGAAGVKDPLADSTNAGNNGHKSIIETWTGFFWDELRKMLGAMGNGGHGDYLGNEVYVADLINALWVRRRNASVADGSGTITEFSDGRPCSDHTTNMQVAAEGRWFKCGMASTNYNGAARYQQWWEYDVDADDYIDLGNSYASGGVSVNNVSLFDPEDRQLIAVHNNNANPSVQFVDLDDLSIAQNVNSAINSADGTTGSVDTTNHTLLVRAGSTFYVMDLDNKAGGFSTLTATGSAPSDLAQFHWHPASNAFLTWANGTGIYKLTPTVSGGGYSALVWSTVAAAGSNSITPPNGDARGMYGKIQLAQDMGDGRGALIIVPAYQNPDLHVFALPAGGV